MAKRVKIAKEDYLKGLNDIIENVQEAVDKIEHGSVQGLADALRYVGTESQKKAPVEYGDLRGSLEISIDGTVIAKGVNNNPPGADGKRAKNPHVELAEVAEPPDSGKVGRISYNAPYAADQHEHTEYDHPKGGQAKYLESVLASEKNTILQLIAGGIINNLEG